VHERGSSSEQRKKVIYGRVKYEIGETKDKDNRKVKMRKK